LNQTAKDHNMKLNIAALLLCLPNFSPLLFFLKTSMKNLKKRAKVIGLFLMKNLKKNLLS
jgi:hypothetical protein